MQEQRIKRQADAMMDWMEKCKMTTDRRAYGRMFEVQDIIVKMIKLAKKLSELYVIIDDRRGYAPEYYWGECTQTTLATMYCIYGNDRLSWALLVGAPIMQLEKGDRLPIHDIVRQISV